MSLPPLAKGILHRLGSTCSGYAQRDFRAPALSDSHLQPDDGNAHRGGIGLVPHVVGKAQPGILYLSLVGPALELEV